MGRLGPIDECSGNILKPDLLLGKNDQDITMDNPLTLTLSQQDMIDLSWLGGLLDGEGSFNLHWKRECGRTGKKIHLQVRMGNTNPEIVSEYIRLLKKFDIGFYQYTQQPKKHHKVAIVICVNRMKSVLNLCKLVYPYLRGKRAHCYFVINYIESRIKRAEHKYNVPYSDDEVEWMNKLRVVNVKGVRDCISSEK